MGSQRALPEGSLTEEVYNLIKKQHFEEAGIIVKRLLQRFYPSEDKELHHPLLELLGYCLYMMKDFEGAAQVYKRLHEAFPDSAEYKVRHQPLIERPLTGSAQCIFVAYMHDLRVKTICFSVLVSGLFLQLHTAYCLLQCGTSHVNSAPAEISSYRQSLEVADSVSFQREACRSTSSYIPEFEEKANGCRPWNSSLNLSLHCT